MLTVDAKRILNIEDINFEPIKSNIIGKSINKVYKGTYKNKNVAIKEVKRTVLEKDCGEVQSLTNLCDKQPKKGIVHFFGCFEDEKYPDFYYLVFEKAENNLRQYLNDLDEKKITKELNEIEILRNITEGVRYIHTNKYIHFDIKCENILMVRRDGVLEACVCDFGHAEKVNKDDVVMFTNRNIGTEVIGGIKRLF